MRVEKPTRRVGEDQIDELAWVWETLDLRFCTLFKYLNPYLMASFPASSVQTLDLETLTLVSDFLVNLV